MFKRKIYDKLLQWKKDSDGKTALLIAFSFLLFYHKIAFSFLLFYHKIAFFKRGLNLQITLFI